MAYTREQIEKYNLTPEQTGTFVPRLGSLEQAVIKQYVGSRDPIVESKQAVLFRQQIIDEQKAEKNALEKTVASAPLSKVSLQSLTASLLTTAGLIRY